MTHGQPTFPVSRQKLQTCPQKRHCITYDSYLSYRILFRLRELCIIFLVRVRPCLALPLFAFFQSLPAFIQSSLASSALWASTFDAICSFISSSSRFQFLITSAKRGSFSEKSAKQDAKTPSRLVAPTCVKALSDAGFLAIRPLSGNRFAKPVYGLQPVPRVRIPLSPLKAMAHTKPLCQTGVFAFRPPPRHAFDWHEHNDKITRGQ